MRCSYSSQGGTWRVCVCRWRLDVEVS